MRSERRHHSERMKAKARRVARSWGRLARGVAEDVAWVGRAAMNHCCSCSCDGCAAHKDVPPRRERAALAEL